MIPQTQNTEQKEREKVKILQTDPLSIVLKAIHKTLENPVLAELTSFRYDDTALQSAV